ncbi:MBL fold metallo-hydrolase [Thiospirochaeta perfilievii]|uniref:MBL fold metallo-hydrolase n=1 Tax=Thiospirochaeta perfilievii TaxID=252967 RepID=A0A5C1QA23_9SPIO|nr:hydroxyacylglutathione hydrolase family protein [Thiospirochaeta perfilievii]QEN04993.1 MBL fold metallo-hydrolase [Thiospirochaeta perfilievii]
MIKIFTLLENNYSYIIENRSGVFIIDPGESDKIISYLKSKNLIPNYILLTHHHIDHVGGLEDILEKYKNCVIIDSHTNKEILKTLKIEMLLTPGHTEDSCCYYFKEEGGIFTGDTLFTGICGRIMDGKSYKEMFKSLNRLKALPRETKLYPGHEYIQHSIDFMEKLSLDPGYYKKLSLMNMPSTNSTIGLEIDNNLFMTSNFDKFAYYRRLKG